MKGLVETAAALLPRQSICHDASDTRAALARIRQSKTLRVVSFLNKDAVILARSSNAFFEALMTSDILFRDGLGAEIIMIRAGLEPGLNMNGTDLIPQIIALYPPETPIALFGTRDPALSGAANALRGEGYTHVETLDGFKDTETYISKLRQSEARLVILGMGMPKQELVARAIATTSDLQSRDMIIVNGGAILDFMSGKITRAPEWMRRAKIEWIYRTTKEPTRLLRRTMSTLPLLVQAYILGGRIKRRIDASVQTGAWHD